jgi:hypothetical protein
MSTHLASNPRARRSGAALLAAAMASAACTGSPPTVTPVAEAPARTVEMTIPPPPGGGFPVEVPPTSIQSLQPYSDPEGRFSLDVPAGWVAQPQNVTQGDVTVGVLFPAPEGNGLLTVTQFDNGQVPATIGTTANQVLEMTGVTKLEGFQELSRTNVIDRPSEAMKLELAYRRSDGVAMHSLVLFQIDGTTFSMVNAGVAADSWAGTVSALHDILASYRVPANAP